MEGLMTAPELVRNVAIIGHLGHGKTAFTDMLVQQTHNRKGIVINSGYKNERFTDTRFDEQERGLSIKAMPVSIALSNSRDKSYLINFMDTPGHVNFADEATAAMRLSDGVIVIVDACEGVMLSTEHLLRHAVQEQQAITVVLNKVDRLILELKLPPVDAYFKLKHTLDEINEILEDSVVDGSTPPRVSPELNNVCFAAGEQGWSFTLRQFAQTYTATSGATFDVDAFARRLWGDIYFNPETRGFVNKNKKKTYEGPEMTRTFIQFIMEPLYKIYAQVVGEESAALKVRSCALRSRPPLQNLARAFLSP
jgi:U5 small nuclear ribonucleoprotein component